MIWTWWSLIPPNTEAKTIHTGNTFKSIDLSKTSCYLSFSFHIGKGYTQWSRQRLGAKMATRHHLHQRLSSVIDAHSLIRLQCNKKNVCFKVLHNQQRPFWPFPSWLHHSITYTPVHAPGDGSADTDVPPLLTHWGRTQCWQAITDTSRSPIEIQWNSWKYPGQPGQAWAATAPTNR